jgi:hypothetical protein
LCGVGVVDLSINPYAHSPVRKATLLSTSEVGLKGRSVQISRLSAPQGGLLRPLRPLR